MSTLRVRRLPSRLVAATSLILAGLCFSPRSSLADGKFYRPADRPAPGEPFQRAILDFHDGVEVLLIQPHLVGFGRDFGWVVPVPYVPRLGSMDADGAERVFGQFEQATAPEVVYASAWIGAVAVLAFLILLVLFVVAAVHRLVHIRGGAIGIGKYWAHFLLLAVAVLVWATVVSAPKRAELAAAPEVVSEQRVGIYETKVLRASDATALRTWLVENGFAFDRSDDSTFASYVERGWLFVASRIAADTAASLRVDELLQPLVLRFSTPEPVYPFALSATAGHPLDLVLYVHAAARAQHRALSHDGSLSDAYADSWQNDIAWADQRELQPDSAALHRPGVLTRLSASLSAEAFAQDLILELDPGREPQRNTVRM